MDDREKWWREELGKLGPRSVRDSLNADVLWDEPRKHIARKWLGEQDFEVERRQKVMEIQAASATERATSAAERQAKAAESANRLALIAICLSILALAVSFAAFLFHR